jgi:hypothetical protein
LGKRKEQVMSDQVCEVCGKELTKWNHAWGTNKCSRCAKGRSPEAKRQKEAGDLQKFLEPFSSLDEVLRSSKSAFFVKAGLLLLVANAIALAGQVAAAVTKNTNFFWIQIAAFVIGVSLGSRAVFAQSNLLNVKRWRTFWPCDIVGYILGYMLFTTIAAFFRVSSTAQGTPLTPGQGTAVQASMVLPVVVGVAFAALITAATDKRRKAWVTKKWNDLRGTNGRGRH